MVVARGTPYGTQAYAKQATCPSAVTDKKHFWLSTLVLLHTHRVLLPPGHRKPLIMESFFFFFFNIEVNYTQNLPAQEKHGDTGG